MNKLEWKKISKNILKAELSKKGIDYNKLSEQLILLGLNESPSNINSKINRGTFSFIFFIQCMKAIKTYNVALENKDK